MVRLRKKSRADSSSVPKTAQPLLPRLHVSSISKPLRNFSRPFNSLNNREYYCRGAGALYKPSSTDDQRDLGTDVGRLKTSLDRGTVIFNDSDEPCPAQGKIEPKKSPALQKQALNFIQHDEFLDRKSESQLNAPTFPGPQDLLVGQAKSGGGSPSALMKGVEVPPSAASVRSRTRRQVPAPAIVGLCTSPECPIEHAHFRGVYLFQHNPMIAQGPFGASNPPPTIWAAYHRLQENQETPEDFALYWGFKRQHTADSWESLVREI